VKLSRKYLLVGGAALALSAGGVGVATATGGDDDANVTGPAADRARSAAVRIADGGKAGTVERDSDEGGAWEVEVTKPDGNTVDVELDGNYRRVSEEGDDDGAAESREDEASEDSD
jgi:hypothetical protein